MICIDTTHECDHMGECAANGSCVLRSRRTLVAVPRPDTVKEITLELGLRMGNDLTRAA